MNEIFGGDKTAKLFDSGPKSLSNRNQLMGLGLMMKYKKKESTGCRFQHCMMTSVTFLFDHLTAPNQ